MRDHERTISSLERAHTRENSDLASANEATKECTVCSETREDDSKLRVSIFETLFSHRNLDHQLLVFKHSSPVKHNCCFIHAGPPSPTSDCSIFPALIFVSSNPYRDAA
jgi:hypothetical protein